MRPSLDQVMPEAWKAANAFASAIREAASQRGLSVQESEFIKLRVSQINRCAFCVDLHSREARRAGIAQQQLDLLPVWREAGLFDDRQQAVLAVAEAATLLPTTEDSEADLAGARSVLGAEAFVAAEWVAVAINAFNRISILSGHSVRPRDTEGKIVR
ncbi:carboxymuconolactone decarboxylase family protein [Nocardia carnea]|uniref:carboxymuconolactone decarboxylase family protein n=1 Tax=Nocardia carnea TaxID=37328 RepID=UPI002455B3D2|nr:carboxymuconolactone decarboxylase family protein [Nocardia carnea]